MIKSAARYLSILIVAVVALLGLAWATSPDPKMNSASFESKPLTQRTAPLDEAITLAQFKDDNGDIVTIQILDFDNETVRGIDLKQLGSSSESDPFAALASANAAPITSETAGAYPVIQVQISDLLPTGTSGTRHIGTGTNFPEHAAEANSQSVFQFPKFGTASPARSQVAAQDGVLLDYEVELCMRFDRDIATIADFDKAVKGLFLCGDFTNRNALVDLADPDNLDSGYGFSDAKSGPDSFPSGPFLLIPKNWAAFVAKLRMTTSVNDEPRQDARGAEMSLDFRQLTEKSLGDMSKPRFLYKNNFYRLAENNRIDRGSTLMSGTSEGVIFTPPTRGDIIEGISRYARSGGPFSKITVLDAIKHVFIENELESGHFLQPGDVIRHGSNHLGDIEVHVVKG